VLSADDLLVGGGVGDGGGPVDARDVGRQLSSDQEQGLVAYMLMILCFERCVW
jgi:hypothetical protein